MSEWTKEILKELNDNNIKNIIITNAFTISVAFLLLRNVMYANYILISFYFLVIIRILLKDVDKLKRNAIQHIKIKSIKLYNGQLKLDEIANFLCEEWKSINKDELIEQIVETVTKYERIRWIQSFYAS